MQKIIPQKLQKGDKVMTVAPMLQVQLTLLVWRL